MPKAPTFTATLNVQLARISAAAKVAEDSASDKRAVVKLAKEIQLATDICFDALRMITNALGSVA